MSRRLHVEETEWAAQPVTQVPDVYEDTVREHLDAMHGDRPVFVTAEYAHLLAHMRGVFIGGIHFHQPAED